MSHSNNSKLRRGLVLEGGGAKGAWQFGALQALDEAGIKFDYAVGTSVGALNGALWASGRLDLGKELWTSMKSSKVFKFRLHHSPLFLVGLFTRIFYAFVKGFIQPEMAPLPLRRILYGLMSLPTIVVMLQFSVIFFPIVVAQVVYFPCLFSLFTGGGIIGAIIFFTLRSITGNWAYRRRSFYIMSLLLWAFLLPYLVSELFNSDLMHDVLELPIFFHVLGVIPFALFCIAVLLRTLNTSIFSVAPLEVIIKDLLAGGFKMPLFATVGQEVHEYFDPDNLKYRSGPNYPHGEPLPLSTIVPRYLRVDTLSAEDALNTLLATSALPLGIAPRRKGWHTAVKLIDGGVVDNIPWYQFIEDVPCDEIVIVCCNPMSDWRDFERKREWKFKNRLLRVVDVGFQADDMPRRFGKAIINDPPLATPLQEPKFWPKRVVVISPDTPLGTFLSGTLNFSTGVARERLDAGHQKASRIIEKEFSASR